MLSRISIVLVEPQMGENIGAAIRVAANFNIVNIRLVKPRDGWPNDKAQQSATEHASKVFQNVKIYEDVLSALQDIHYTFAVTARMRDINKKVENLHNLKRSDFSQYEECNVAFLFGSERNGLSNDDISFANKIITIPTGNICSSLNLAQAIGVVCYKLSEIFDKTDNEACNTKNVEFATKAEIYSMVEYIVNKLDSTDFLQNIDRRKRIILTINNMFLNNSYSKQEISIFYGMIRSITKK